MKLFTKIKNSIRNKLVDFLGISDIQKTLQDIDQYLTNDKKYNREKFSQIYKETEAVQTTLKSILSVGADILPHESRSEHSWAVVCIEGNVNIVKFVNLERRTANEVLNFLKQFEGGRMVIDTPYFPMLYDGLTFNKDFKKSKPEYFE